MSTIHFSAKVQKIGTWTVVCLPKSASTKFPSRGIAMAEGTINGFRCQIPLEPDGKGSHWFNIDKHLRAGAAVDDGDTVTLAIEPAKDWPEPTIPADVKSALIANPKAHDVWMDTTTMARWDWIRWIRGTNEAATRKKRIGVAIAKLKSGMRRPCCFNRSMCTEPAVSKGGVLVGPGK